MLGVNIEIAEEQAKIWSGLAVSVIIVHLLKRSLAGEQASVAYQDTDHLDFVVGSDSRVLAVVVLESCSHPGVVRHEACLVLEEALQRHLLESQERHHCRHRSQCRQVRER